MRVGVGVWVGVVVGTRVGTRVWVGSLTWVGAGVAARRVTVGVRVSVIVGEGSGVGVGKMEVQLLMSKTMRMFDKIQSGRITF